MKVGDRVRLVSSIPGMEDELQIGMTGVITKRAPGYSVYDFDIQFPHRERGDTVSVYKHEIVVADSLFHKRKK